MPETATTPNTSTPTNRSPRAIGAGAGLLAFGILLGLIAGVVWGFIRPTYVVEISDGNADIDFSASDANVEFAAVGWLALLCAVIGVILALAAWRQSHKGQLGGGILTLLWLVAVASVSAFTVIATGQLTAQQLYGLPPEHADQQLTGTFTVAPMVQLSVVWLVAPFFAALLFWMASVLSLSARR